MRLFLKKRLSFLFPLFVICIILINSNIAFAESRDDIQFYVGDDSVVAFLPAMEGTVSDAAAQIGNLMNTDVRLESVNETDQAFLHTIFLFDNSMSISISNRDKMKAVVDGIVKSHINGEKFSLYTFDTERRELLANSQSYDELIQITNSIEFANQDTYLKNVLYDAFTDLTAEKGIYYRFIVLSDGTDDNPVGITYDEIMRILDRTHYPVYVIGSRYEQNDSALEELFSIARASSSVYYLLDDSSDPDSIASSINAFRPAYIAYISIPDAVKDGSDKTIRLEIKTDEGEYLYRLSAEMPFGNIIENRTEEKAETESEKTESIVSIEQESLQESETNELLNANEDRNGFNTKGIMGLGILAVVVAITVVLIVISLNKRKNKKINQRKAESVSVQHGQTNEIDDNTVLIQDEDEEETVLMEQGAEAVYSPKTIMLRSEDGNVLVNKQCSSQIVIGRKALCDVQIQGDKSVSGTHCTIYSNDQGFIVIRDNNSSNGTYVNDEKVTGEHKLENGDTIRIGRTTYDVFIR